MPGIYAHYRFGKDVIALLDPKMQRTIGRFRQLYDMGLHGPDLFYYTDPLGVFSGGKLGHQLHQLTGQEFFTKISRGVKMRASEGMDAYLYGLLAHYTLDSICHPFMEKHTSAKLNYNRIGAEFDRYLLEMDGKKPPHLYDRSRHIGITSGEAALVAAVYPNVNAAQVVKYTGNMAKLTRSLAMPESPQRDLKLTLLQKVAPETAHRTIALFPCHLCAELDPGMMRLYEIALKRYNLMLEQLLAFLKTGTPLGPEFNAIFGK